MAIMYALVLLMAASILYAAANKEPAETVFPWLLLSVMGILFLFYCFDLLLPGAVLVYGGILCVAAGSLISILRQKRPLVRSVGEMLTPGVFLFAAYCGFVFLYTRRNLVGLWDEMRLWGAVPKALYETHSLQLGSESLIFPAMQAYPPGMPLLVYFMELLSPRFSEGHIFVVYGVFFGAMLLPAMRNLKWKQWAFFVPLLFLLALAPCIFTSHGGDDGWFYESLFIDPILGVLAGYAFWMSARRPFASSCAAVRFGAALLALTIIKDSGAMFALFAAANALVQYFRDKEHRSVRGILVSTATGVLPVLVGYGLWRWVIAAYGIGANASGVLKWSLSWESLEALWVKLLEMPMLNLREPLTQSEITLSYLPCLLGLLLLLRFTGKESGKKQTIAMMLLSFGVFLVGYRLSFRTSLPSFQRYVSTTLICALCYGILQGVPRLPEKRFSAGAKGIYAVLCLFLVLSGCRFLEEWSLNKYPMEYTISPAKTAVSKISKAVEGTREDPADIYVLIAEQPRQKSLIHHRIYYELLGTNACVRNFWNDVNIVGGEETPEAWTEGDIAAAAAGWTAKLESAGYDYVYVTTMNEFASAVLETLGIPEAAPGDMYAVAYEDGKITLEKV